MSKPPSRQQLEAIHQTVSKHLDRARNEGLGHNNDELRRIAMSALVDSVRSDPDWSTEKTIITQMVIELIDLIPDTR